MWPFKKRKPESQEEKEALAKLDEATRGAAWGEEEKEAAREAPFGPFEPLGIQGLTQGPLHGDPDPTDEQSMRDVLREGEQEYEEQHSGEKS